MASGRPFVGGNWKMNLNRTQAVELVRAIVSETRELAEVDVAIFPPSVYLDAVGASISLAKSAVALGAQNFYPESNGAYTGELSIDMLRDFNVTALLVGHSERRHVLCEPDELIRRKTIAAIESGMTCVLCVGETLEQREAGAAHRINEEQTRSALEGVAVSDVSKLVLAYEPVWAIGTGKTATPDDAQNAHAHLRQVLSEIYDADTASAIRIIYGGSVKPSNANDLFSQPDIDGGLIGGASLDAAGFLEICNSARQTGRLQGVVNK